MITMNDVEKEGLICHSAQNADLKYKTAKFSARSAVLASGQTPKERPAEAPTAAGHQSPERYMRATDTPVCTAER